MFERSEQRFGQQEQDDEKRGSPSDETLIQNERVKDVENRRYNDAASQTARVLHMLLIRVRVAARLGDPYRGVLRGWQSGQTYVSASLATPRSTRLWKHLAQSE